MLDMILKVKVGTVRESANLVELIWVFEMEVDGTL